MSLTKCAPSIFSHPIYTDYVDDVVETLREKEKHRYRLNYTSPQIEYRDLLVDFMRHFAEKRFNRTTLHLGVYFLDVFMDSHQIAIERLNLVAIVCLLVAAKIDEKEQNIPKYLDVIEITSIAYPAADYVNLERMVLCFFEWDLLMPTAVNFIELYIEAIVTANDYQCYTSQMPDGKSFSSLSSMKLSVASIVGEFLDLCLYQLRLPQEIPSRLAASIVAATRYVLYLDPVWTVNLTEMTGYDLPQVEDLVTELLHLRRKLIGPHYVEKKNTPDSGYVSVHDGSDSDPDHVDTPKRKCLKLT